jgi:anti-sigma28 factor (negative regulator of flagellin synthesis)
MAELSINPSTGVERPGIGATFMRTHGGRARSVEQTASTQAPADRGRSGRSEHPAPASADRVDVSDQARLLSAAVQAAQEAPDSSEAAIERARQKRDRGELGRDAERLADKLIDSLLR